MKLIEKLVLNQKPIQFIQEGLFLKVYNESLFLVTQQFDIKLRPQILTLKSTNQRIIFGGFPINSLYKWFPQAIKTQFGYELVSKFDLTGYVSWFQHTILQFEHAKQYSLQLQQSTPLLQPVLTRQQLLFLEWWQPNKYPTTVDTAFLLSLKECFNGN